MHQASVQERRRKHAIEIIDRQAVLEQSCDLDRMLHPHKRLHCEDGDQDSENRPRERLGPAPDPNQETVELDLFLQSSRRFAAQSAKLLQGLNQWDEAEHE